MIQIANAHVSDDVLEYITAFCNSEQPLQNHVGNLGKFSDLNNEYSMSNLAPVPVQKDQNIIQYTDEKFG